MKKGFNLVIFGFVFLFSTALIVLANKRYQGREVGGFNLKIHQEEGLFLTENIVNNLLIQSLDSMENTLNSELNLYKLECDVSEHPLVKEVLVYQGVEGAIGVEVIQKKPVLRLYIDGSSKYLDSKGKIMPLSSNFTARLPVYRGPWNEELKLEVYRLISRFRESQFWIDELVGLTYKMEEGFVIFTRTGGHEVVLGSLNQLGTKLNKYEVFLRTAQSKGTVKDFRKINLKFNNQVVCSK
jgi:cell division protein FtsQ